MDVDSVGEIHDQSLQVVTAELRFADGKQARKEVVFGGGFSEEMPAELTSIAVRARSDVAPESARCLTVAGKTVAPVAVERGEADVFFVVNGDAGNSSMALRAHFDCHLTVTRHQRRQQRVLRRSARAAAARPA